VLGKIGARGVMICNQGAAQDPRRGMLMATITTGASASHPTQAGSPRRSWASPLPSGVRWPMTARARSIAVGASMPEA